MYPRDEAIDLSLLQRASLSVNNPELKKYREALLGRIRKASPHSPACTYSLSFNLSQLVVEVPEGYLGVLKSAEYFEGAQCRGNVITKIYIERYSSKGSFSLASEIWKLRLLEKRLADKSRDAIMFDIAVLWGDLLPKGESIRSNEEASLLSYIAKLIREVADIADETDTPLIGISEESARDLSLLLGPSWAGIGDRILATLLLEEGEYLVLSYGSIMDRLLEIWDEAQPDQSAYLSKLQRRFQFIEKLLARFGNVLENAYIIYYVPYPRSLAIRAELYLPLNVTPGAVADYLAGITNREGVIETLDRVRLSSIISREEALNAYETVIKELSRKNPELSNIYALIMKELKRS